MTEEQKMKITITPEQIESREHFMFVGKKRMTDMANLVNRHEPIVLTAPVYWNDKQYGIIVPMALLPTDTSKYRLTFQPLHVRCYRVCHIRSTKIKALILDLDGKQVQCDESGVQPSAFTLNGNGVDPELVDSAETDLAYALSGQPDNPACKEAVKYIKECASRAAGTPETFADVRRIMKGN